MVHFFLLKKTLRLCTFSQLMIISTTLIYHFIKIAKVRCNGCIGPTDCCNCGKAFVTSLLKRPIATRGDN